jgi:microcystin-dependent protein
VTYNTVTATTYNGLPTDTYTLTTAEDITAGDVVRIAGGNAYKATNTSSSGITAVSGVATNTASLGTSVTISYGYYESFSGLTVGSTYYVGTNGGKTLTKPQDYPFEIGIAVSTTRINFLLKEDPTPAGNVIPYSIATAPAGYILCNGADISRVTHARLFGVVGTTYGVGDGGTTFGLPELRAEFIRGLDLSRGVDSGRAIGTSQADATAVNGLAVTSIPDHTHLLVSDRDTSSTSSSPPNTDQAIIYRKYDGSDSGIYSYSIMGDSINGYGSKGRSSLSGGHTPALTGDTETRPANVALAYCIKL